MQVVEELQRKLTETNRQVRSRDRCAGTFNAGAAQLLLQHWRRLDAEATRLLQSRPSGVVGGEEVGRLVAGLVELCRWTQSVASTRVSRFSEPQHQLSVLPSQAVMTDAPQIP